jgi:pilus assembly protein Flp/PilA
VIADTGRRHAELRAGGSAQFNRPAHGEYAVKNLIVRFVREDAGQDLIEYGLLIGIITVLCIASIKLIGPKVGGYFSTLNGLLP